MASSGRIGRRRTLAATASRRSGSGASMHRADQFRSVFALAVGSSVSAKPDAAGHEVFTGTLHDDGESPVLRDALDRNERAQVIAISSALCCRAVEREWQHRQARDAVQSGSVNQGN